MRQTTLVTGKLLQDTSYQQKTENMTQNELEQSTDRFQPTFGATYLFITEYSTWQNYSLQMILHTIKEVLMF